MAAPVPTPEPVNSQVMKVTLEFEGNGGGFSESFYLSYGNSETDPYGKVETFLAVYLLARRGVLSETMTIVGCRISQEGVFGDHQDHLQPTLGLGVGQVAGPPADINNGLQYVLQDPSNVLTQRLTFSGWAQADMNMTTSSARDRPGQGPQQTAWLTYLRQGVLPQNNVYSPSLGGGKWVVPGKPRGADAEPKLLVDEFTLDGQGRLIAHFLAPLTGFERGKEVQIMYNKNRYVRGLAQTCQILDSRAGTGDWEYVLAARPTGPIELLTYTNIFLRLQTRRFYVLNKARIGLFVRRANGAEFFVRRGRRPTR